MKASNKKRRLEGRVNNFENSAVIRAANIKEPGSYTKPGSYNK